MKYEANVPFSFPQSQQTQKEVLTMDGIYQRVGVWENKKACFELMEVRNHP